MLYKKSVKTSSNIAKDSTVVIYRLRLRDWAQKYVTKRIGNNLHETHRVLAGFIFSKDPT